MTEKDWSLDNKPELPIHELHDRLIRAKATMKGAGVLENSATIYELATKYYERTQYNEQFKKLLDVYKLFGYDLPETDFDQAMFIIAVGSFGIEVLN